MIHAIDDLSGYGAAVFWATELYYYRRLSGLLRHELGLAFCMCAGMKESCVSLLVELSLLCPGVYLIRQSDSV